MTIPVRREWCFDEVIGGLHSTSFVVERLFGDRREAFEAGLTNALVSFVEDGVLVEDNAFTVLTARRPSFRSR
ncbi:hypothetical protein [Streptomyces sp. NPDC046862]|uniref:hypothetical protein n=1 Tax=Streptomyces sp. NPDC046862 TaxID=3154603 RepID=UPI00345638CA